MAPVSASTGAVGGHTGNPELEWWAALLSLRASCLMLSISNIYGVLSAWGAHGKYGNNRHEEVGLPSRSSSPGPAGFTPLRLTEVVCGS